MKSRTKIVMKNLLSDVLQVFLILVGITLLAFLLLYLSPGNPAQIALVGTDGNVGMISEEALRQQEELMGLNRSFFAQYWSWLRHACTGDLGMSFMAQEPVTQVLGERMMPTILMTLFSLLLTVVVSIPLGILCAVKQDRWVDNLMRVFSFLGISIPSFVLGVLFLWLFCIKLRWFTIVPMSGAAGLVLPILVLALQTTSKMTRQVRAIVLDELHKPYVEGALMRGAGRREILFSHVLKNSAAPILTNISIYAGALLGGSVVIESIFSVNGLGRMAISAVGNLDYNLVLGFVLWCTLVYLILNLLADVLAAVIDPRIKYTRKEKTRR